MFKSFFPEPRLFFLSAAAWAILAVLVWHLVVADYAPTFAGEENGPLTPMRFIMAPFAFFYAYYWIFVAIFGAFWMLRPQKHPWAVWSIFGSALIFFASYFSVEVDIAINDWYGVFYNMLQAALGKTRVVTVEEYWSIVLSFLTIAGVAVIVLVITRFFVSHYIFRWRTAMNDYYVSEWLRLRHVEGASQRVQDDTMRFAATMEALAVSFVESIMTLIAFMPVLITLNEQIKEVPIFGEVPYSLVIVSIVWSLLGTGLLALVGIRLPGLEFRNQRVEAAYRKELVYGEDFADRAQPEKLASLFSAVRKNYFTLYFNYVYFNVVRYSYLQVDALVPLIVMERAIVAGAITLGVFSQVQNVFDRIRGSFQYLVNSWPTIVELLSIYKRLSAFEATLVGEPLGEIEHARTDGEAGDPAKMVT